MFLSFTFTLLQVVAIVNAAYTPRSNHARHAALLRARSPVPLPAPQPVIKKRDSKKCRVRSSSSSAAPSSTPIAPVNPASDPNPPAQVTTTSQSPTPSPPPPTHTTHKDPPPSPTTTHQPKPTPTPTSSSGSGNSGGGGGNDPFGSFLSGTQTGQLTYYELGLTSCGQTYSDSDMVCAVSHLLYDSVPGVTINPNDNPVCNQHIRVTYQGNSILVKVVDRCTGCDETSIDLSPNAFSQLAPLSDGRLFGATWEWA